MQSNARWWMPGLLGVWLAVLLGVGCGQPGGVSEEMEDLGSSLRHIQARTRIAAGGEYSLAVRPDGTVWAAGDNSNGQLGDGTTTQHRVPVRMDGAGKVERLAEGYAHSLAVSSSGAAWAWGSNAYGQLGTGTTTSSLVPVQVQGPSGMVAVSASFSHSLAVGADGSLWAWGDNGAGQLGNQIPPVVTTPVRSLL